MNSRDMMGYHCIASLTTEFSLKHSLPFICYLFKSCFFSLFLRHENFPVFSARCFLVFLPCSYSMICFFCFFLLFDSLKNNNFCLGFRSKKSKEGSFNLLTIQYQGSQADFTPNFAQ